MKILHTADIHLREHGDERWQALEKIIEVGKENTVDILAICGDLFDKDIDAEELRPYIRELFSDTGFKVLIIPGNHDSDSYKSGMYFGGDVFVLTSAPFELGEVRIVGIPFEPIHGEDLIKKIRTLKQILTPDKKNVLLSHGELLDAFFSRADFGAEGEGRYMPFRLSYFDDLNIDYVLTGHFHSKFRVWQLKNGGYFVYPGSPVSITKGEVGQRKVNLFNIGEPPSEHTIDTFHFQQVSIELDPFQNDNPVEIVKRHFESLHPNAKAILTVSGYMNSDTIQVSEPDMVAQIKEVTKGKCAEEGEHYQFKDISRILEDDLFKSFTNRIMAADYIEQEIQELQDIAIRAMMRAQL